jgi:hypothetical protein
MAKDDTIIPFSLRLRNDLLQAVAEIANAEGRSTNQEIIRAILSHVEAKHAKVRA